MIEFIVKFSNRELEKKVSINNVKGDIKNIGLYSEPLATVGN